MTSTLPCTDAVGELLRTPTHQETDAFFAALTPPVPDNLEVRADADGVGGRGKGVFVKPGCTIAKGAVLFREAPRVGVEHFASKQQCICCDHCYRYVDDVHAQLSRRLQHAGYAVQKIELHKDVLANSVRSLPTSVPCRGGCGIDVYCSNDCRDAAWAAHHGLLCTGPTTSRDTNQRNALVAFGELADTWTDHLGLAARVFATTVSEAIRQEAQGLSADEAFAFAWRPWRQGVKSLWWHTAQTTEGTSTDTMARDKFEVEVKQVAHDSLQLLKTGLTAESARYPALFSLDVWGSVLGMLDSNCMGIKVGCPIKEYLDGVLALDPETTTGAEAAKADAGQLWELLPGVYDAFCDGGGFFSLQSVINHDCSPNAMSGKHEDDVDGRITLRALRDLHEGEELSISYVERDLGVRTRQAQLKRTYQFTCTCDRCRTELASSSSSKANVRKSKIRKIEKKKREKRKIEKGKRLTANHTESNLAATAINNNDTTITINNDNNNTTTTTAINNNDNITTAINNNNNNNETATASTVANTNDAKSNNHNNNNKHQQ